MNMYRLLPLLAGISMLTLALATTVELTISSTVLPQRTNSTKRVLLTGLETCSTTDVTSLQIQLSGQNISFTGRNVESLWFGAEVDSFGGFAYLSVTKGTTVAATDADGRISLLNPFALEIGDETCLINAHISTNKLDLSIVIGTFADGTVWAEVVDLSDPSLPQEIEMSYDEIPPEESFQGDDDGSVIQINVPYTYEAMCFEAGLPHPCDTSQNGPIIAKINALIAEANTILQDSATNLRIDGLIAWRTLDYAEPRTFTSTLSQMQAPNDNVFENPSLLNLRNENCADLVCLMVRDGDAISIPGGTIYGQVIGIGPNSNFYSMVSSLDSISISGYTFTHELAHLLGCRHENTQDPSPSAYARGYNGITYSTIMTTRGTCGFGCTRLPVFSKPPPFLYMGRTVGDASNADNVRRIEETRLQISNYRSSSVCSGSPTTPSPPTPTPPAPSPPTPPSTFFCFSSENSVEVQGKGLIPIGSLEIGEWVRVSGNDKYSQVYSRGRWNQHREAEFIQITTKNSVEATIEVTAKHLLYVYNGSTMKTAAASDVRVGYLLVAADSSPARVIHKSKVKRRGIFAPFTTTGDIVVSGLIASNYATIYDENKVAPPLSFHWGAHAFKGVHRMACRMNFEWCKKETYTVDGISRWIPEWHSWFGRHGTGMQTVMVTLAMPLLVLIYVFENMFELVVLLSMTVMVTLAMPSLVMICF